MPDSISIATAGLLCDESTTFASSFVVATAGLLCDESLTFAASVVLSTAGLLCDEGTIVSEMAASLDAPVEPASPVFVADRCKTNLYTTDVQVDSDESHLITHNLGSKYVRVDVFFRETELSAVEYSVEPQWAQSGAAGGYFLWVDEDDDGDPTLSAAAGPWVKLVDANSLRILTGEDGVYVGALGTVYTTGYYRVVVTPMGN